MSFSFQDRHHGGMGFRLVEEPSRLLVETRNIPLGSVAAWMLLVFLAGLGLLRGLGETDPKVFTLWVAGMGFISPVLLGFLHLLNLSQREMGPILEVDRTRRVVVLPRDGKIVGFDDIQLILRTVGWFWSERGDVGWERLAEVSLIVREDPHDPSRSLILRHGHIKEADHLAVRVAQSVDRPVERENFSWKDRRNPVGHFDLRAQPENP